MEDKLHFLAVPLPLTGHMNSMLHLCMNLASWFHVRISYVCSSESYGSVVRRKNFQAACGPCTEVNFDIVCVEGAASYDLFLESFIQSSQHKIHCIISDAFLYSVQDISDKFNIPRASFSTVNAANDIILFKVPELVAKGFIPVTPEKTKELIDFVPGVSPITVADLPLGCSEVSTVRLCEKAASRFLEADYSLCNTYEELEPDVIDAFRKNFRATYYTMGPCIPTTFLAPSQELPNNRAEFHSEEDIRCLAWLDRQVNSSVLYISFGTLAKLSADRFLEVLAGVELSRQPFLLVKRTALLETETPQGLEEIITREFEDRTRDRGLVVSWAPQMLVLLHPAVGGFFTHCGWNSSLESICAGVPMLACPCMGEQNVNSRQLVSWKVALEVKDESGGAASRDVVSELVNKLFNVDEGRALREQARALGKAAKVALAEGGSSYKNLEAFVEAIKN